MHRRRLITLAGLAGVASAAGLAGADAATLVAADAGGKALFNLALSAGT
jgi:hypothetical protein